MKKIIIFAVALLMAAGSAFAAPQSGSMGISVGMGDSMFGKVIPDSVINNVVNISGRYFVSNDMAVTAGFGLQMDGGDADGSYISLSGGLRKYLSTGEFATFVAGKLTFATAENDVTGWEADVIDLEGSFGAEYFFSNQFSMEGAIGVGIGTLSQGNVDDTYFGTRTVGVTANFYF